MPHIRTKRKPTSKNIFKLIFSILVLFLIIGFIYSLGFISKGKDLTINNNYNDNWLLNKINSINLKNEDHIWTLNTTNTLNTDNGDKIFVQLAADTKSQEEGLSSKDILKQYDENGKIITEGMLFVFNDLGVYTFWMKDMRFNLDILWLDENYNIVHIEKNALADSYNNEDTNLSKIYSNGNDGHFKLAKYVLEINSNLSDKMNLKEGDKLTFN